MRRERAKHKGVGACGAGRSMPRPHKHDHKHDHKHVHRDVHKHDHKDVPRGVHRDVHSGVHKQVGGDKGAGQAMRRERARQGAPGFRDESSVRRRSKLWSWVRPVRAMSLPKRASGVVYRARPQPYLSP